MPLDSLEFRTSLQRLLVGLLLILVPVTIFGSYFALQGESYVRQINGDHFRTFTRTSADLTAGFVGQLVRDVGAIANSPSVMRAVTTANRPYERFSEDAIRSKVDVIENKWNAPENDALSRSILTSDLAHELRRVRELNANLLKITVGDINGAAVAATDRPLHYLQTDPDYRSLLHSKGPGAIQVSDVRYDEQSQLYYLNVTYPISQEGTGRFIGAVTALVDLTPLFAQLKGQQIGRTGHLFLVSDDGVVIQARGVTPGMKIKSEEYAAIRDALGTLRGREAGYIYTTLPNGERYLLGFSDAGLRDAYPNLSWIVLASQEEREAVGPIRAVAGFALFMTIMVLLMVTLLGAYVFLHRKQKLEDIETPPVNNQRSAAA